MVDCIKDPIKRLQWDKATSSETLNQMIANIKVVKAKMQPYSLLFDTIDFENSLHWCECSAKTDENIAEAIKEKTLPDDIPENLRAMVDCIKVPMKRQQWDRATTMNTLTQMINDSIKGVETSRKKKRWFTR